MTDCWLYAGTIHKNGYGVIIGSSNGRMISGMAHRVLYENIVGEIPKGLQIDHLCRVRRCINPSHLEPVTKEENYRRGKLGILKVITTHCPEGHEYTPENTYIYPYVWKNSTRGHNRKGRTETLRMCRLCRSLYARQYRRRLKERKPHYVV